MKRLILTFSLLLLFETALSASQSVTLRDGNGDAVGTTANPIKASVTGAVGDGTGAGNFTTIDGTDLEILTGDFNLGNGTPSVTMNGEDAYIEGSFEVDGASRFDGAMSTASISSTSSITSSTSGDIGWSVVDQTDNQACNTGCTNGCVFGFDNATGTAVTNLVSCAATTADLCVCSGAS